MVYQYGCEYEMIPCRFYRNEKFLNELTLSISRHINAIAHEFY